jgi:hypothetical protein
MGGPDPLIGRKGKVFGINIHDLKALEDLRAPSPEMMPIQVKKHLVEQMLVLIFPPALSPTGHYPP